MLANLTITFFFDFLLLHPFYVSVCEINFNEKNSGLEITHRIFADDLSMQLSEMYNENVSFASKSKFTDAIIRKYLAIHFSVTVNGKESSINYLGYELEEDAIWIYEEVKNIEALSSVEIKNTLLMDYIDEQSNIVHFKYRGETKSFQLTVKNPQCKFSGFTEW